MNYAITETPAGLAVICQSFEGTVDEMREKIFRDFGDRKHFYWRTEPHLLENFDFDTEELEKIVQARFLVSHERGIQEIHALPDCDELLACGQQPTSAGAA